MTAGTASGAGRMRVCHVTSVHVPTDSRVLYHECRSLAKRYETVLVCRSGAEEREIEGVRILALPRARGRLGRVLGLRELVAAAEAVDADTYHFHDPELLSPMAAFARRTGRPVIYDAHEHYPDAMDQKAWIPRLARPLAARWADATERGRVRAFDAVVVADTALESRFSAIHDRVVRLDNYPPLDLLGPALPRPAGRPTLAYVGSLSAVRGFFDMLETLKLVQRRIPDARLLLYGSMTEEIAAASEDALIGFANGSVELRGSIRYGEIPAALAEAHVGLSLLRPHPKYEKNVSMKVFDYMALGIPWLASDFEPLRVATRGEGGFLVTPGDPTAAADRAVEMLMDRRLQEQLGTQGRGAAEDRLNWESVEQRLFALYDSLARGRR